MSLAKRTILSLLLLLPAFVGFAQSEDFFESGTASFYHDNLVGRKTANGERFSQKLYTCAHKSLPFGTKLKVTNLSNGKSVVVTVNDRGPFPKGRIIDLSKKAAGDLDFIQEGLARVTVEIVPDETDSPANELPPYLVLNDSTSREYAVRGCVPYSINMGDFELESNVKKIVAQINQEIDRQVLVQQIADSGDTTYRVYVGLFYRQEEAKELLDLIENYYPNAKVSELGANADLL